MKKKKALLVFAHPDDEVIWGWPLLQDPGWEKEIVICSSDRHNPERAWCAHRRDSLAELCASLGIAFRCFDLNSEFYRLHTRIPRKKPKLIHILQRRPESPPLLGDVLREILEHIRTREYDCLFTHNFWGEYGHLDHILINALMFANIRKPILVGDARIPLNWVPLQQEACAGGGMLTGHLYAACEMDPAFYETCSAFYKRAGTWTWSIPPVAKMNMYLYSPDEAVGFISGAPENQPRNAPDSAVAPGDPS